MKNNLKPKFPTNQAALEHFQKQALSFEKKYNRSFEDLWLEAENSSIWTEDMEQIHSLQRSMSMCKYLLSQGKA